MEIGAFLGRVFPGHTPVSRPEGCWYNGAVGGPAVAARSRPGCRRRAAGVHIVGEEADKVLRRLTGQSFDYRSDDPAARESAIAAWRQWRASQGK